MNMKKTLTAIKKLQEVKCGKVGWVSLTELSKAHGMDRAELEALAAKMGLQLSKGGRHGVCAAK